MRAIRTRNIFPTALIGMAAFTATIAHAANPLTSWNDGRAKQASVTFVEKATKPGSHVSLDCFDQAHFQFNGTIGPTAIQYLKQ